MDSEYEVLEKIGEGTFGIVYTATHKISGDVRAIKVVKRKGERFFSETKLLQEIALLKELVLLLLLSVIGSSKYYTAA